MQTSGLRKIKIHLADYPYRQDIENRVLLAQLSVFEVKVLREIIYHSLKISVGQLADQLGVTHEVLKRALDKLSQTKLFKQDRLTLTVDKEMRKYYESQIEKFDEDFRPHLEFVQGLLSKIPMHVLPNWYAIPRSADHIFTSIIETYFLTPKIYRQCLEELEFDNPILSCLMKDLYQAPHFKLYTSDLIEKYKLSREQLEEYLILLEYHFVCYLSYQKVGDQWQEIITPFEEWRQYLEAEARAKPPPIADQVIPFREPEFGFLLDMGVILKASLQEKLTRKKVETLFQANPCPQEYIERLLFKLSQLEFILPHPSVIRSSDKGALWLSKSPSEQSASLGNNPLNQLSDSSLVSNYHPRRVRQIEKSLRVLREREWVYLDDFLDNFMMPLNHKEEIQLVNKGKKWRYVLPIYTDEEKRWIRQILTERLFELGIIALGKHQEKICFHLTSFGRHAIA